MLKIPYGSMRITNYSLAVSFTRENWSAQSLGYILISIALNPLERHNRSAEILISVSV